ncbi:putative Type IV pilus secretin PilQ [Vibrio nigripulchritudo SFn27]|uniref:Putative Type IV pilus secretin PilQ n=1 Tax=Vibrio nigripulchritudo TaxID=28173 RepID=U4KHH1_9VIBR|nr:type IV pilus secretin PilQ family protein [Vibrio nigripulchritudo]CCN85537.1 putative Type IV pilus secretin PilQ [Vibrio nigripulchritudo BLFn1]CCN88995.1 putative Type IV pilus secretin PilQ [Vibrio nigripulchritudo SFn27]CCN95504.1 putative Type IV pilus secretin PilQ [Vibrio nigripulchritudo ENn2]CCO43262.1 putative Type IV pilus secretin PilQ [Vibrio nigripulchritudo SFn135]CCO54452.1 putative Type IV pilus secretin PilQ [Vibrio nigripulchritudo Wn13]
MAEFCRAHIYRCALLIFIGLFSTTGVHAQSNEFVGIDFRLSKEKHALLVVELASNAAAVDIQPMPDGLNISLHETSVVDEKLFVVDVSDFATSVENVEVFREGSNTRLFASTNAAYNYDYRLRDRFLEITVSAKPKDEPEQASILEKEGKLISINFQDIPVRSVLQLIADYNGFNLVVSDSVTGNLTLKVDDVPWQQVLDIILKVKGLDKRVEGNVILVAPKEEFDQREQQDLEQERLAQELGTLESKIVEVKFAKASDIAEMIGGDGEISMLSERGSISIDERTNSLLVRDLPENISVIEDIVESLDIPVKQVQIEARIVTVTEGELEELGVRWGFSSTSGPNSVGATIENNLATVGLYQAGGSGGDSGGEGGGSTSIDDFLAVNLGATNANAASIAFQVAKLGSDTLLDLELSALQTENKAEIISSPRLITTNKKPAYIEQGTEIPYLEASSSGATTVAFRKAVLSLKVTPQITPDNKLVLDLSVTQDRPGKVVKTGNGEALAIETQRIGTQVLVDNGETVVLGGIYQQSVTNTVDKVPLLGDLPLLGALFRRSYENLGKSELLIFITPKVVLQ